MKYTLVLFFALLLSVCSYSQVTTNRFQKLIQSTFFNPGDTITKFIGLLTSQVDTGKEVIDLDTISAKGTYRFLPALNDSVELGKVKFKSVFLQTSKDRKIIVVGFTKSYFKKDGDFSKEYVEEEYNTIVKYLDEQLKIPSTPYEHPSRMFKKDGKTPIPHSTKGLTWKKEKVSYRIYLTMPLQTDIDSKYFGSINVNAWKSE